MADAVPAVDDIDLSSIEFWAKPWAERDAAFATLRRERPVAFFEELEMPPFPKGPGYYAVTRYADVLTASKSPDVFSSAAGAVSILDMPAEMNEYFGSMISMDDPRHARLRRIVSGTFTPKMLNRVLDQVAATAADVVEKVRGAGVVDFVAEVSSPFPLIVVCDLMGIPESERQMVLAQSNIILSGGDPEFIPEGTDPVTAFLGAGAQLVELMNGLAAERRERPTDDLTSALVNTAVDGEQLSGDELASFFILLSVAGHETTRNGISHGVRLLGEHPDQRAIWQNDPGVTTTAVDEVVRVASPVVWMRRTLTRDAELSGVQLHEGDKVLLFYGSANRDDAVFADPERFDVRRDPNPHVGFGGPGPHFCLGAHLARREIALLVGELFRQVPDFQLAGPPEQLRSNFINGIKHLPVDVGS
jgi:methyl-branched lipid omega-hydroxylase